MSYHGTCNWPPVWIWIGGLENNYPKGEAGILKSVAISEIDPCDRLVMFTEYKKSSYAGCVAFDDPTFCKAIATLLNHYCDRSLSEIGSLDMEIKP
jgi:hypothetical protein